MEKRTILGKSIFIRGKVIGKAIFIEKLIDKWLAKYFCNNEDRSSDLYNLILCHDRLGFEAKRQVFCYIVENKCPIFFKLHPTLNKDLAYIIEQRNVLAHYLIDTTEDAINATEVGFLKMKNKTTRVEFSLEKIENLYKLLEFYGNEIKNLVHPPLE